MAHKLTRLAAVPFLICLAAVLPHAASESPCALTGSSSLCSTTHRLEREAGGLWRENEARARLQRVGARLVRHVDELPVACRFHVLKSDRRNAYSFSCGCIYVTRGLFRQLETDDALAGVLAHEMSHVVTRDGKRPCQGSDCQLARELEADRRAVDYLQRADYRPRALGDVIQLLRREQGQGWADRRLARLNELLQAQREDPPQRVGHSARTKPADPPPIKRG